MGDFCTDEYLTPKINTAYGAQLTQLEADADSSFDERLRDIPAVPLGTTNLGIYQADQMPGGNQKGPLAGLITPITVEWKIQGQPDDCYVEAGRTGKLPNVSPAAPIAPYRMQWELREGIIYLTPLTYPADMRVRGEFALYPLVQDKDKLQVHPRMYIATAFATAAIIGAERNNQNWINSYKPEADAVLEDIENILIKAEQGTVTRIGRLGGHRGRNNTIG